MKRSLLLIAIMATLGWTLPASAIKVRSSGEKAEKATTVKQDQTAQQPKSAEKSQKGKTSPAKAAAAQAPGTKPSGSLLDNLKRKVLESKKKKASKYDHFRDADHDGVADRVPKPAQGGDKAIKKAAPKKSSKSSSKDQTKRKKSTRRTSPRKKIP